MPPKKAPAKKKKSADTPQDPEGAVVLNDLLLTVAKLRLQLGYEEKQFNHYLTEKQRIEACWQKSQEELAQQQTNLRVKQLEREDAEDLQRAELKEEQNRNRYIRKEVVLDLLQEYNASSSVMTEQIKATGDDKFKSAQDLRDSQLALREFQARRHHFLWALKIDQDEKVMNLRLEFDQLGRDLEDQAARDLQVLKDEREELRLRDLERIENSKTTEVEKAMAAQVQELLEIKKYFADITVANLDVLKRVKEEHAALKTREQADARTTKQIEMRNKALTEPLKDAQDEIDKLRKHVSTFEEVTRRTDEIRQATNEKEALLKNLSFQKEVLTQQLDLSSKDRDAAADKYRECVIDLQRRTSLKNLVLQKKVAILEASVGDDDKRDDLVSEIEKRKSLKMNLIRDFEQRLGHLRLPIEDLGFTLRT